MLVGSVQNAFRWVDVNDFIVIEKIFLVQLVDVFMVHVVSEIDFSRSIILIKRYEWNMNIKIIPKSINVT